MKTTTRRTIVGTAVGVSLVLVAPFAPAANAKGHHTSGPETGRHGWHSSTNPAEHTAKKALRAALKAANASLHTSTKAARDAFRNDPAVKTAAAARLAIVTTATDPTLIIAANDAYTAAVAGPALVRDTAIDAAQAAYVTAVDAAYTAYDTATTTPAEAAARSAFRSAMRSAKTTFGAALKSAHATFKSSTALARATQRAAVNAAMAVYLASPKSDTDKATFKAAVHTARDAYKADPAVIAAEAAKHTATSTARTAYQAAVKAARDAFFAATGHNPKHIRIMIPRV